MALSKPTPKDPRKFIQDLEFAIARRIVPRVKAATPSKTLRAAVQFFTNRFRKTVIGVPHYWAVYYHDGTGTFGPIPPKTWLVWFPNALADDPRLGGRYPVRYSEWRPLSKEEFKLIVEINKAISGKFSTSDFAIITKSSGPRKGIPFMDIGFRGSAEAVRDIVQKRFSRHVASYTINETSTAKAKL